MDLYFNKNSSLRFRFPVTPGSVTIATPGRGRAVRLIDSSEISALSEPGLREVSFEALLPNRKYPFAIYPDGVFRPAAYYLELLEQLEKGREPFVFILGKHTLMVSMEGCTLVEDAALGKDVMVKIRLREARGASVKVVVPQKAAAPEEAAPPAVMTTAPPPLFVMPEPRPAVSAVVPKTYTVVRGDTLWGIAKRFLGNGARWPEIHALNRDKVSNPNRIYPGQVLTLP
jgi:hypothetical protein